MGALSYILWSLWLWNSGFFQGCLEGLQQQRTNSKAAFAEVWLRPEYRRGKGDCYQEESQEGGSLGNCRPWSSTSPLSSLGNLKGEFSVSSSQMSCEYAFEGLFLSNGPNIPPITSNNWETQQRPKLPIVNRENITSSQLSSPLKELITQDLFSSYIPPNFVHKNSLHN